MYKTTRQKILDYLEKRETVTASELAQAFRMTAANARHHLACMVEEGVVIILPGPGDGIFQQPGQERRGRPDQLYRLRKSAEADNLSQLAEALLRILVVKEEAEGRLEDLGRQLSGGNVEGKTLTLRLQQAIKRLNAMQYRARWEAHSDAPRLVFGHCPYAKILSAFPQLCTMDAKMLEEMLGGRASQAARLEEVQPGIRQCVFRINR